MKNEQYHIAELERAWREKEAIEKAPLADRKEGRTAWAEALKDPNRIAERIAWLLNGDYGYGQMVRATEAANNTRMNRVAFLSTEIACYEWRCPYTYAVTEWKKLTKKAQGELAKAIEGVIKDYQANIEG